MRAALIDRDVRGLDATAADRKEKAEEADAPAAARMMTIALADIMVEEDLSLATMVQGPGEVEED